MTPIEKAVAKMGGQTAAARALEVSGYQVVQQWIAQRRVPADYCPRIERLTGVRCEELNNRVDWSLIRGTAPAAASADHGAELRRAISETRIVFESEPTASDALNYLEAVLAAAAPVPGQTGISTADQAAATMAAESAQLVAGAEKVAAGAAARAEVDPLAVLSREVFSLSNKLQQPVDLVVQLMVLGELRGLRADHARSNQPLTVVLS